MMPISVRGTEAIGDRGLFTFTVLTAGIMLLFLAGTYSLYSISMLRFSIRYQEKILENIETTNAQVKKAYEID